ASSFVRDCTLPSSAKKVCAAISNHVGDMRTGSRASHQTKINHARDNACPLSCQKSVCEWLFFAIRQQSLQAQIQLFWRRVPPCHRLQGRLKCEHLDRDVHPDMSNKKRNLVFREFLGNLGCTVVQDRILEEC